MNILRLVVAVVVTIIWAAVWITAIITSDYGGVGGVTPVMLGIVAYLFTKEWAALHSSTKNKVGSDTE